MTQGADIVALLCTGKYQNLEYRQKLIRPYVLLHGFTDAIFSNATIGILVPTDQQIQTKQLEWEKNGRIVLVKATSPYSGAYCSATIQLNNAGADCVVLDCLGFTSEMKEEIQRHINIPVILPVSILAWALREIL